MKKALTLFLAVFGIFCFSSVVSAEGFTVLADCDSVGRDVNYTAFTLGGGYDVGSFIAGASYSFAFSYSPALPSGVERADDLFCLYGGYKFLNEKDSSLALVVGYNFWNKKISNVSVTEEKASYICLGAKGSINIEPIDVNILLLYGVYGNYREIIDNFEVINSDKISLIYLDLMENIS